MARAREHWQLKRKQHLLNYRAAKLSYRIANYLLAKATESRCELPYDLQMRHHLLNIGDYVSAAAAFTQESYVAFADAKVRCPHPARTIKQRAPTRAVAPLT